MERHEISWITARKTDGDEYKTFRKTIRLSAKVSEAYVRFESDCVCGVCLNGAFITSGAGHYPGRVNCREVSSLLAQGENGILVTLGTRFYQGAGIKAKKVRGFWYSSFALELEVVYENGKREYFATDPSWETDQEGEEWDKNKGEK